MALIASINMACQFMDEISSWTAERELLRLAKQGNVEAARDLMNLIVKPAHALAWRILRNQDGTQEVVQEALFQLWRSAEQFKGTSSLKTYFCKIVMRECHAYIRHTRSFEDVDTLDQAHCVMADFQIDLRLHQEVVHQALEALSSKQRMALVLWAFHDMTATEIGQVMEMKKNAVDQLLWRAKNALRTKLTER